MAESQVHFTVEEIKEGCASLWHNVECLTCSRLLAYIKDLLSMLDLSGGPKWLIEAHPQGAAVEAEWLPIEQLPATGEFLVYLPDEPESMRYQVMRRHPNATVIGHNFAYDLSKPSHFMPVPPPPNMKQGLIPVKE